jgi:hypothetical protein
MKEESFEEQFPELKDFDVSNYVGLHGIINDVAIKELIQSCCLSKKRVKEVIDNLESYIIDGLVSTKGDEESINQLALLRGWICRKFDITKAGLEL